MDEPSLGISDEEYWEQEMEEEAEIERIIQQELETQKDEGN